MVALVLVLIRLVLILLIRLVLILLIRLVLVLWSRGCRSRRSRSRRCRSRGCSRRSRSRRCRSRRSRSRSCRSRRRSRSRRSRSCSCPLTRHTARHPQSRHPPRGKYDVSQNAVRMRLSVSQLEAQDSVHRLDVEELMDCQTEIVRHQFERLVVRQTTRGLHRPRLPVNGPGLFAGPARVRRLMLFQHQLRDPRSTRRRPEGMVVVGTGHLRKLGISVRRRWMLSLLTRLNKCVFANASTCGSLPSGTLGQLFSAVQRPKKIFFLWFLCLWMEIYLAAAAASASFVAHSQEQ